MLGHGSQMPCPDGEHRLDKALHRTFRAFLFSTDGKHQLRPKLGDGGVSLVHVDAGDLPVELGGRFCNVRCRASHNVSQAPGQGQGLKRRAAGCSDKQPATTSASPYAVAIIRKMCLGREGKVFAYLVQTRCPLRGRRRVLPCGPVRPGPPGACS